MESKTSRIRMFVVIVLGASMGLAAPACGAETKGHCWVERGDETCKSIFKNRPFCSTDANSCGVVQPYGCMPTRPESDVCYSPCGGGVSHAELPECTSTGGNGETTGGELESDMPSQTLDLFDIAESD